MIKLYELVGAETARRFSPYCWRIVMALAHKRLPFETVPVRFTDKELLAFSGQGMVPVLKDGDTVVSDSWQIARYLEERYPDRPPLFGGEASAGQAMFFKQWAEKTLHPLVLRMVAGDIARHLSADDQAYFIESRQQRFGMPLAQLTADREQTREQFRAAIAPLRATLELQPWIGGAAPTFADYIAFGVFQWARSISDFKLLETDDAVYAWRERLLERFDGLARQAPGYPV